MSQYHKPRIRRTFDVTVVDDSHPDLYYGQRLTVIGERNGMYQVSDDIGRFGMFRKNRFVNADNGNGHRPSGRKRVRQEPEPPVRCKVMIGEQALFYADDKKLYDNSVNFTVFRSRKEAHRAVWHTVNQDEWVDGYDPRAESEQFDIVPVEEADIERHFQHHPDAKFVQVRW